MQSSSAPPATCPLLTVHTCMRVYRWLGVEHVYLTENAPQVPAEISAQLQDFVDAGFLTLSTEALQRAQTKVYYDCMSQHYHKHNWLMFFDMDEYLVIVEQCGPFPWNTSGCVCAPPALLGVDVHPHAPCFGIHVGTQYEKAPDSSAADCVGMHRNRLLTVGVALL